MKRAFDRVGLDDLEGSICANVVRRPYLKGRMPRKASYVLHFRYDKTRTR